MEQTTSEVVVVGGGPAGLTAAIALAQAGVDTALIMRATAASDNRTTALLAGSVTALETLRVWQRCAQHAAPLRAIRIVDDTGRLIRAPEVRFDAAEIGLAAFGYNIENRVLLAELIAQARGLERLSLIEDEAEAVTFADHEVSIRLRIGDAVSGRLAIGAEGRQSLCRWAAGIATERTSYPQIALTVNLGHARPHA